MIPLHTFTRYVIAGFSGGLWGTLALIGTGSFLFTLLVALIAGIIGAWTFDAIGGGRS